MSFAQRFEQLDSLLRSRDPKGMCAAIDQQGNGLSFWEMLDWLPAEESTELYLGSEEERRQAFQQGGSLPSTLRGLSYRLRTLEEASACPIVAITGMLNAGKSSLLASLLSPGSRHRILIGQANDQGTHRFVLWVPEAWRRDEAIWQVVQSQVTTVFGAAPERLSDDPLLAAKQYNGHLVEAPYAGAGQAEHDPLVVPLIASDPWLDRWGIALMDCPDIQTGLWQTEWREASELLAKRTVAETAAHRASRRAAVLSQSLRLCSAFLVVTSANGIHDQLIYDLLATMHQHYPKIARMLMVNRVPRRYLSQAIREEVQRSYAMFELHRVYMAYHFEGPHDRERLPVAPSSWGWREEDALPLFFRIDEEPVPQPPAEVPDRAFLNALGEQLDRGHLMASSRRGTWDQYVEALRSGWRQIQRESQRRRERLGRIWQILAESCYSFYRQQSSGAEGEPTIRLQASREILKQVGGSLERTAPMWAKPGRKVLGLIQNTGQKVGETLGQWSPAAWVGGKVGSMVESVQGRFRRGEQGKVVTASILSDLILQADLRGDFVSASSAGSVPSREGLTQRAQRMIDRFQVESQTRLDEAELDALTRQMWSQMSWRDKVWAGVAPSAILFGPLLAVIALPFDFGGSSILVFASLKELLVVGGAGLGMGLVPFDNMPKLAEAGVAWQQLSDLFAVGCDEMGVRRPARAESPRLSHQGKTQGLGEATLAVAASRWEPMVPIGYVCQEAFWSQVEASLVALEKEISE